MEEERAKEIIRTINFALGELKSLVDRVEDQALALKKINEKNNELCRGFKEILNEVREM